MDPVTQILAAMLIAVVAGSAGNIMGNREKITESRCKEKQESCMAVVFVELGHIKEGIADVKKELENLNGK